MNNTQIAKRKDEDNDLKDISTQYRRATNLMAKQFVHYVTTVGPELKKARKICDERRGASWSDFCDLQLGCCRRHADRLIAAGETIGRLVDAGQTKLPAAESVCRELTRLDDGLQVDAWHESIQKNMADRQERARNPRERSQVCTWFPQPKEKAKGTGEALRENLLRAIESSGLSENQKRRYLNKPLRELLKEDAA